MKSDDEIRTRKAVVVCLRNMGDGTSRFFFDDLVGDKISLPINWRHDGCFTSSPGYDNFSLEKMELDSKTYEHIGKVIAGRLLAINRRI